MHLAIPAGAEDAARRLYVDLLGLREVPKPSGLAGRDGAWFVGPEIAFHLGVDDPFVPARKAHPAFLVDGLERLLGAFAAAGVHAASDDALRGMAGVRR